MFQSDSAAAWDSSSYGYGAPPPPTHGAVQPTSSPQITQASLLGAAANINVPANLDLNAIQQSLAAHGLAQPPPPPPVPAPAAAAAMLFPAAVASYAGMAQGMAGLYPAIRRQ